MLTSSALRLLLVALISLAAGCTQSAGGPAAVPDTLSAGAPPSDSAADADVDPALLAELRAELARVLASRGITLDAQGRPNKAVSSVPRREYRTPARFDNPISGEVNLLWLHYMQGDYDWNGEVNVSDITPIGVHFGKTPASPDWQEAQRADGDGNGEINIADITPIGQNFAARLAGYVVQWRGVATDEWSDFGFRPFDAALVATLGGELGYDAPGALGAFDFRVAPVGETREFRWVNYQLDSGENSCYPACLGVDQGLPGIAFVDQTNGDLFYGEAAVPHPLSAADWTLVPFDPDEVMPEMPQLHYIGSVPAIAYVGADPVFAYQLRYARITDFGPGYSWQGHVVKPNVALSPPGFIVRDSTPVLAYPDGGDLKLFQTGGSAPQSAGDWQESNASLDTNHPDLTLIAGRLNIASYRPGPTSQLHFSRALVATPIDAGSFTSYILNDIGGAAATPSIAAVGGYPCIAYQNELNSAVEYLRPSVLQPDSAGVWFVHPLFSGSADYSNPQLALADGRPAVCYGRTNLNFAWADREVPDEPAHWLTTPGVDGEVNYNTYPPSLVVVDGLPLIAYTMYDPSDGSRHVFIAAAQEL